MAEATAKPQYEKADQLFEDNKFQETLDLLKTFEVLLVIFYKLGITVQ